MEITKKRVFIGSSSEEVELAELAKTILEKDFDVTIWNESLWDRSVFKINQNFLSDLLKASLLYDFGLLIGTKDDKVSYRGKDVLQPRDNVLFELGLFTGRMGTSKCAFVVDEELKVLSDLNGISLARFDGENQKTFVSAIEKVKELFLSNNDIDVNFFPSATLAAVYFENLIHPICRFIREQGGFDLNGKKYPKCKVNVIIPERINHDVNLQFEKIKSEFNTESISFQYAGRPRQIHVESKVTNGVLEFVDFPTVIAGINHAISNLLPSEFNRLNPECDLILQRELKRFVTTLKGLLLKHGYDDMVCIKYQKDFVTVN
jgi:hypothetical protein